MTPEDLLNAATRNFPGLWRRTEEVFLGKGKTVPDWDSWCFIPLAGWYAMLCAEKNVSRLPDASIGLVAIVAAVGAWRYSRGIYRMAPELLAELCRTDFRGKIPMEVLLRLPEWCIYIDAPVIGDSTGFFAHLEHDANTGRTELRVLVNGMDAHHPYSMILHIDDATVDEAIDRAFDEATVYGYNKREEEKKAIIETIREDYVKILNVLLYICSDEPDITGREKGTVPGNVQPQKTKKGLRLFPASKTRIWDVGVDVSEKIASAKRSAVGTGKKAPHLRRAHWHGVWTGKGRAVFRLNWLPPIFVGGQEDFF